MRISGGVGGGGGGGGGAPVGSGFITIAPFDAALPNSHPLDGEATVITVTVGGAGLPVTVGVATNGITDAKLRQGAALTVIGRSVNSLGNVADIAAGVDGQILRRSGVTLGFGTIVNAGVDAAAAVAISKLADGAALSVVGNGTNAIAAHTDLVAASDGHVMRRSGVAVAFGTVVNAGIDAAAAITYGKLADGSALSVIGRSANSIGANASIASAGTTGLVLVTIAGPTIGFAAPNFGAQNVTTTGIGTFGYLDATGGTLPASGFIRAQYTAAQKNILTYRDSGAADRVGIALTGDVVTLGDLSLAWMTVQLYGFNITIGSSGSSNVAIYSGATAVHVMTTTSDALGLPIVGNNAISSPYSVHGGVTFAFTVDANYTVTAAQYRYDWNIYTTGALTLGRNVTYPAPASLAAGYYKTIKNSTTVTLTITTGAGTTVALLTTVTARCWFDSTGVQLAP